MGCSVPHNANKPGVGGNELSNLSILSPLCDMPFHRDSGLVVAAVVERRNVLVAHRCKVQAQHVGLLCVSSIVEIF